METPNVNYDGYNAPLESLLAVLMKAIIFTSFCGHFTWTHLTVLIGGNKRKKKKGLQQQKKNMLCPPHRTQNMLLTMQLKTGWISADRVRLNRQIQALILTWYLQSRQTLSKHTALTRFRHRTVGLGDISPSLWIPEATHAARLMDTSVNTRSIWSKRPHKPQSNPCRVLHYPKCPCACYGSKCKERDKWTCEWGFQVRSNSSSKH